MQSQRVSAGLCRAKRRRMEATTTLADLARTRPSSTRVFMRHKLDFCCGGRQTLAAACAKRGLDTAAILAELESEARRGGEAAKWATRTQAEEAGDVPA